MKHLNKISIGIFLIAYLFSPTLYAQEEAAEAKEASIMVVTKVHWDLNNTDGSQEKWLALEKEFFDKVTAKNEYIMGTNFLTHYFTADNSEAIWVTIYSTWGDMEKANDRTNELIKEGWPDEAARDSFFKDQNSYYTSQHSDEIYSILDGHKSLAEKPTEPLLYYARVSHLAFPDDAVDGEMKELHTEFLENVTYKNEYVKGYWAYRHMWGADSRELTEVYAIGALGDIEASFEKNQELMDAKWSEEEQKAFGEKYGKYWSGFHADYVWRNVPALMK